MLLLCAVVTLRVKSTMSENIIWPSVIPKTSSHSVLAASGEEVEAARQAYAFPARPCHTMLLPFFIPLLPFSRWLYQHPNWVVKSSEQETCFFVPTEKPVAHHVKLLNKNGNTSHSRTAVNCCALLSLELPGWHHSFWVIFISITCCWSLRDTLTDCSPIANHDQNLNI